MKISSATRKTVEDRAGGLCEYCQLPHELSAQPFSIEHIIPKSKEGTNELDNLALACQACNNAKYNKTGAVDPISQQTVPLYNPRLDDWNEHFAWSEDFSEIVGLTAKGRATVKTLKMNRERTVKLRNFLIQFGEHPPI